VLDAVVRTLQVLQTSRIEVSFFLVIVGYVADVSETYAACMFRENVGNMPQGESTYIRNVGKMLQDDSVYVRIVGDMLSGFIFCV
jgi:hypothetical protein